MTLARPQDGSFAVSAPEPVGELATLLARLRAMAGGGAVAMAVDLPLGLPSAYAVAHLTARDFPDFLRGLEPESSFFQVCATLNEISPGRPFYPARGVAGMTRLSHAQALGLTSARDLSRACDQATPLRPAGAPLFWTLGANQVGKAAISAWRDLLIPALHSPAPLSLWPFEGSLAELLRPNSLVLAETYPAEAMRQRGVALRGSKRHQPSRAALAPQLSAICAELGASLMPDMTHAIESGFGADQAGEDRFDSLLGLLGLLAVLRGIQPDFIPSEPQIRTWEGWVLGQTFLGSSG